MKCNFILSLSWFNEYINISVILWWLQNTGFSFRLFRSRKKEEMFRYWQLVDREYLTRVLPSILSHRFEQIDSHLVQNIKISKDVTRDGIRGIILLVILRSSLMNIVDSALLLLFFSYRRCCLRFSFKNNFMTHFKPIGLLPTILS